MAMSQELDVAIDWSADELPPAPTRRLSIAGYDILEEIGAGGMGVVYRARHRQLGRTVALKLLRAGALAGPTERHRFLREARAGAGLQHPGLVQVFEVGEYEGCPFLALEFVPGTSLARKLLSGVMPPRDAAALVEQLARAVQYAHERGVIHRDLKPANVLLNDQVDSSPKIADFGLARLVMEGGTDPGTVMGTPAYMAPEQAQGQASEAGAEADVDALGAILFECITGQPPFQGPTSVETLRRVLSDEAPRASRLRPGVPSDLDTICQTCMAKMPSQRYSSAAALADDLQRFQNGRPILARPIGPWGRFIRWVKRNPRVAALLLLLAGALAMTAYEWRRSERLFATAESARVSANNERLEAEANLGRYRQAANDFAGLLDSLDTDQLFHLRWAPLRRELVVPALERNREFIARHDTDGLRRSDVVLAHFRVALLTRILSHSSEPETQRIALVAAEQALAALEAFAGERADVVQYRRDRAALTHNLGFLLHVNNRTSEALIRMESACDQRQRLLDLQPGNLDYRSELAGCWNDRGMMLTASKRFEEAVVAIDRAIELQTTVLAAAPQVVRYKLFLCNHHFNRAIALRGLGLAEEAVAAVIEARNLRPDDPEQWIREARVLAAFTQRSDGERYVAAAIAAVRRAVELDPSIDVATVGFSELAPIRKRPEFQALVGQQTGR
jgi:serine/threonine protein kinase